MAAGPTQSTIISRITADPRYDRLRAQRNRLGWILTLAMLVVYYGFILLVAFGKGFLSTRIGDGVTTIGIPLGLGVIAFTVLVTAYYVRRANGEFDALADGLAKEALK